MIDLANIHENISTYGELERAVASLGQEICRLRSATSVSAEEVQALATCITHLRLLTNELERNEVRRTGASRELAGRQVELSVTFRTLRTDLDQIMMRVGV